MEPGREMKVALVGAGFIANTHIQILKSIKGVEVVGICDTNLDRGKKFASSWGIPQVFREIEDLIQDLSLNSVHVLVPPPLHFMIAKKILDKGIHIFVEKPFTLSSKDAEVLIETSNKNGARVGVNHNMLFHPAYLKMRYQIDNLRIGKTQHVNIIWKMPLRQLLSGDFSNWMFQDSKNIIFEQAPHVFSLIHELVGPPLRVQTIVSGKREVLHKIHPFFETWQIQMECERGTASCLMAFGKGFPENRVRIIGQGGAIDIDFLNHIYQLHEATRWPAFYNSFVDGIYNSTRMLKSSSKNLLNHSASLLRIQERKDGFYLGMKNSIEGFYNALSKNTSPPCSGEDGLRIVQCCEEATSFLPAANRANEGNKTAVLDQATSAGEKILVTGGTGFIGRYLVGQLVNKGFCVRLLVRKPENIPAELRNFNVRLVEGDIMDREAVSKAVRGVGIVYHLATGSGNCWEEIQKSFVEGLRNVAEACLYHKVEQLHFTSSIAANYLGRKATINEKTPIDDQPEKRGLYSRAKIESERLLVNMYENKGLPIVIYRPGIVVGKGNSPYHSGLGLWINDGHCIGWNMGVNELPFVLIEDVATALIRGMEAKGLIGKCLMLAGDVRISARRYIELLAKILNQNIRYYPRAPALFEAKEMFIWAVKKVIGRPGAELTTYRDIKSRGMLSRIDCSQTKELINWAPNGDLGIFIEKGINCYSQYNS